MDEPLLKPTGTRVCAPLAPAGLISQTRVLTRADRVTQPHLGDGCTQDHGRSRGRGAEGAPDGRAWVGRGVGALLSQDSPSGLLRDDPSANKTFLKSLVQKSNIYLAGTVSLYKVSPS